MPTHVNDMLDALSFADRRFADWQQQRQINSDQLDAVRGRLSRLRDRVQNSRDDATLPGLPPVEPDESAAAKSLRYWLFLAAEVRRAGDRNVFRLSQTHELLDEVRERRKALERRLRPDEIPSAVPVAELVDEELAPPPPPRRRRPREAEPEVPRRSLLEILLDPRNIQYLLAFGGALMVVGVVILLWINEFFTPALAAAGLAGVNAAFLFLGWYLIRQTSYQTAGRALTLLACLVMPLNLWYLNVHATPGDVGEWARVDRQLWAVGVAIAVSYLASALVLRDELFVWVSCAGVTMAGLLVIASLPPSPDFFWGIAYPATLLVGLGLLGIHLERLFPDADGPFGRKRFGLAFFWSGHVQLMAGLLLLLGAFVYGDWLSGPFEAMRKFDGQPFSPPAIVQRDGQLWLAIALIAAATYAYVYSDVVVRQIGLYVLVAAFTLTWLLVLILKQLQLAMGVDALIAVLAGAALVINLVQAFALRDNRYTRAFPVLGVIMPLAAVVIGALVYLRSVLPYLVGAWEVKTPDWWPFLGAMALTAVSCRVGAFLYRERQPALSAVYHFATGAATMTGAATLLAALGLRTWQDHVPLLMLLPLAYLLAARAYKGSTSEAPMTWLAHAATGLLLVASFGTILFAFFGSHPPGQLNLMLALFFGEVALFYALCAGLHRQAVGVPFAALAACGAVWQLFDYVGASGELHVVVFALVGVALLLAYRLSLGERLAGPVPRTAFETGNVLLLISFVSAAFLGLARLSKFANDAAAPTPWTFIALSAGLTLVSLLAVFVIKHSVWRPLYVVSTIGLAGLTFLSVAMMSKLLSPMQKVEVVCVAVGLVVLVASHVGWFREQERESELVTLGLLFGSLLVGVPLALATLIDRANPQLDWRNQLVWVNELGWLGVAVVLFVTGFLFRLKATTVIGGILLALYFATLLVLVPWSRLNTVALVLAIGGGSMFLLGLVLSVFRESLLKLPQRVRDREGVFRVLSWR